MRDYKGFTPQQRLANLDRVKQAIKDGILPSPFKLKCEICGQNKGIREYHCKDYTPEKAMESLQCLCYKCHRYLHVFELGEEHKYYKVAQDYFNRVKQGEVFDPVFRYDAYDWKTVNDNWEYKNED